VRACAMMVPGTRGRRPLKFREHIEECAESDALLLQRVASGDRAAFHRLYDRYRRTLMLFLRRFNHRVDLLDEIVNDTMYVVWCKAGDFRGDSRPSTWIHGIAYRQALKRLDRRDAHLDSAADIESVDESAGGEVDASIVESAADRAERSDWLQTALAELPREQRAVLELTYFHGHSCQEIAELMGCPVNTVKTRMFHARLKLRERLPHLAGLMPCPSGAARSEVS